MFLAQYDIAQKILDVPRIACDTDLARGCYSRLYLPDRLYVAASCCCNNRLAFLTGALATNQISNGMRSAIIMDRRENFFPRQSLDNSGRHTAM